MPRRDAVGATTGAGQNMIPPLDQNVLAEDFLENSQLRPAEILAGGGGDADRTMVFDQHESAVFFAPFGHIAFARADIGERAKASSAAAMANSSRKSQRVIVTINMIRTESQLN